MRTRTATAAYLAATMLLGAPLVALADTSDGGTPPVAATSNAASETATSDTEKVTVPTVDKAVSADGGRSWSSATSASGGSDVLYKVRGTLPQTLRENKSLSYAFIDKHEPSLAIDAKSVRISLVRGGADGSTGDIAGTATAVDATRANQADGAPSTAGAVSDVTSLFSVREGRDASSIWVECADVLAAIPDLSPSDSFEMTYAGTLSTTPDLGMSNPNENACRVEYAYDGRAAERTPDSLSFVYSWRVSMRKVEAGTDDTRLSGAKFTIRNADGKWLGQDGWVSDASAAREIVTDGDGTADVRGLGTGSYVISETAAPRGYDSVGDIALVIEEQNSNGKPSLVARATGTGAVVDGVDASTGTVGLRIEDPKATGASPASARDIIAPGGTSIAGTRSGGSLTTTGDRIRILLPIVLATAGTITIVVAAIRKRHEDGE